MGCPKYRRCANNEPPANHVFAAIATKFGFAEFIGNTALFVQRHVHRQTNMRRWGLSGPYAHMSPRGSEGSLLGPAAHSPSGFPPAKWGLGILRRARPERSERPAQPEPRAQPEGDHIAHQPQDCVRITAQPHKMSGVQVKFRAAQFSPTSYR